MLDYFRTEAFYQQMQLAEGSRVVVAMSGGVDSSVASAVMHYAGYDVVGLTLQLYDGNGSSGLPARKGACCAGQDIYDAKAVAAKIGFPHYIMDMESRFKQAVIDDFVDSYARGETPLPCVRCNQTVKFQDLLKFAKELGAKALVTGHYCVRHVEPITGEVKLLQAKTDQKDQSYFLFATTKEQLDFLRFPLGHFSKAETRQFADHFDLKVADKPDSQDICFVPNGRYADVVRKLRPDAFNPGNIVDQSGAILGQHEGIAGFTIGQRKGLGIGGRKEDDHNKETQHHHEPLYVIALNPEQAEVVVGPREALATPEIQVRDVNWLDALPNQSIQVKIRNVMTPVDADVEAAGQDQVRVRFHQPQYGVSAGQACVFYKPDYNVGENHNIADGAKSSLRLLGGGWIEGAL